MKDATYRKEYAAIEEEFTLAAAMVQARARAGLTQEQLAPKGGAA